MRKRDIILTGLLLMLIGVLIGMIITIFRTGSLSTDFAEVRYTEVERSNHPFWNEADLERMDSRFLLQKVAREVTPTVVYIETIINVGDVRPGTGEEEGIWERIIPRRARTVGSGVVISADGYILTNNHVIEDAVRRGIQVTLDDKRTFNARVIGGDPSTDLAVIKIDAAGLKPIILGNSDSVEVGEWVLAVGNPFRLRSTVTAGIVSALSRDVEIINDILRIESFIQTDAAINRGNSGGALVNTSGELIGINTAIATQNGNYQGYGFAVPSNLAMKVAGDIIEFGEVRRGLLGVNIRSVDNAIASDLGLRSINGVLVVNVSPGGAAEKSGLRPSDVILAVNEHTVNEVNQLQEKVAMFRPGDTVSLRLWRRGEEVFKDVTLEIFERPEPVAQLDLNRESEPDVENETEGPRDNNGIIEQRFNTGFTVRGIARPENHTEFDLYVHRVERGSEAWDRGIRPGFKILEVDGEEVAEMSVFDDLLSRALSRNGSVNLKTQNDAGITAYFQLKKNP